MTSEISLYISLQKRSIDRPLSRALRDRAAALYFQGRAYSFAPEDGRRKPHLAAPADCFFNVTHTGPLFLCAFAPFEIGIDAEDSQKERDFEALAKRFFSLEKQNELAAQTNAVQRRRLFYRFWTQSEAVSKLSGLGLEQIIGRRKTEGARLVSLEQELREAGVPARFVGTLACAAGEVPIRVIPFSREE